MYQASELVPHLVFEKFGKTEHVSAFTPTRRKPNWGPGLMLVNTIVRSRFICMITKNCYLVSGAYLTQ